MNNKLQIIETNDYILAVSEEEVKEGEKDFFIIANDRDKTWINRLEKVIECKIDPKHGKVLILSTGFIYVDEGSKIIAYQPKNNAPELDLPLLPEIVVEDEVEKLADEYFSDYYMDDYKQGLLDGFRNGYNYKSATKVYSEKDLMKAIEYTLLMVANHWSDIRFCVESDKFQPIRNSLEEFIQSLNQTKTPKWFVAEIEYQDMIGVWVSSPTILEVCDRPKRLKTTTINSKTYLIGTYLYE